jgi:hypothetical protein
LVLDRFQEIIEVEKEKEKEEVSGLTRKVVILLTIMH